MFGIDERYYRGSDGVVLVYSITDRKSFTSILEHFEKASKELDSKDFPLALVGTKLDLDEEGMREVSYDEGKILSQNLQEKSCFFECSAKENRNVKEIFEELVRVIPGKKSDLIRQKAVCILM
eukprot:TRINITY_DN15439_c0_g1_i1.p1 TRINITY_DN15439_c0_g1~~TRINITY_DN15439_c0_g1_i1.p1  ORF type:complete len:123 (-),score=36.40 TRINITY_DN15439_c0_g1_i1:22-390(-)